MKCNLSKKKEYQELESKLPTLFKLLEIFENINTILEEYKNGCKQPLVA